MTNNTHLWYYLKYHVGFSSCYCKTDIKLKAKFMSTSQILFVKSMIPFWYSTFKLSSLIKLQKLLSQWKEVFIAISTPKISIKSWGKTWWGGKKKELVNHAVCWSILYFQINKKKKYKTFICSFLFSSEVSLRWQCQNLNHRSDLINAYTNISPKTIILSFSDSY